MSYSQATPFRNEEIVAWNPDVIDTLAGLAPNSPLALIRDQKPVTREQA